MDSKVIPLREAVDHDGLRFQEISRFELESGAVLRDLRQAYRLDGRLNAARDNLVLVFHSLSAGTDAVGGWWEGVVGPGRPVDSREFAVLVPNLLGSCFGTTGPAEDPNFPPITIRDMVRLIRLLVDELGVRRVRLATGGSLGGMVALEWAATFPDLTETTVAFAAPATLDAYALGWNHVQRRAIQAAGIEGLEVARVAGMLGYRTAHEFETRFGRDRNDDGRFQIWSYLDHHGAKLARRMHPASYLALLDAIAAYDVGEGRGGVAQALGRIRGRLIGVGIPGDLLYPDEQVRGWVEAAGAEYRTIESAHGHDGFLLEADQVGAILREALGLPARITPATRPIAAPRRAAEA